MMLQYVTNGQVASIACVRVKVIRRDPAVDQPRLPRITVVARLLIGHAVATGKEDLVHGADCVVDIRHFVTRTRCRPIRHIKTIAANAADHLRGDHDAHFIAGNGARNDERELQNSPNSIVLVIAVVVIGLHSEVRSCAPWRTAWKAFTPCTC